jgi:hypothetical protein
MKLSIEEQKYCDKLKRKVSKTYTKVYLKQVSSNRFTVEAINSDFEVIDVLSEMYQLPVSTPVLAWEIALVACRVMQNINRTHPLKVSLSDSEGKFERVRLRKLKNTKK